MDDYISSWIRNSYIWTFAKEKSLISFDLNSESARAAGLREVAIIHSGPSSDSVSGHSHRELRELICLSYISPFVLHDLIALKPTESSQGYAPTGVVVQVASDFREIRWHSVPTNLRCTR